MERLRRRTWLRLSRFIPRLRLAPFHRLLDVLSRPFDHAGADNPELAAYRMPAPASQAPYQTFCGT